MRKFVGAAFASALLFTAAMPNSASAFVPPPPVVVNAGTSAATGVGITTGFIGLVALLDLYDIIRRTTCSGDFLSLGGPGFGQAITPGMNVLPPRCIPAKKRKP
jgi:hypothetical protein